MTRRTREQSHFRFSSDPDPRYCAKALCRARRRMTPTHVVTIGTQTFRLCTSCARPYEGIKGVTVAKIEEVKHA